MDTPDEGARIAGCVGALIFGAIVLAIALWSDGRLLWALGALVLLVGAMRLLSGLIACLLGLILGRP